MALKQPKQPNDSQDLQVEGNGWGEWAHYVLNELKRLNAVVDDTRRDINGITVDVVQLKVKSTLWGAGAGAFTVFTLFGVTFLKDLVTKEKIEINTVEQRNAPYVQPYIPHPQSGVTKMIGPDGREYFVIPSPQEKEKKENDKTSP